MTLVIRPVKVLTRLNGNGSEWRSERVRGMPHPLPTRQGVTVRVQTGTTENWNRFGFGFIAGETPEADQSRPEEEPRREGALPNRDPPCSTPPPIRSHTTLTENPLPLAPTLTYI